METLIAISLLLLAITGPMVFAQNALRAAFNSRDQVTAYYLAQDAIEFVKNVRDHNILSNSPENWITGFEDCETIGNENTSEISGGCSVDTSTGQGEIKQCVNGQIGCLGSKDDASEDIHLKISGTGIMGHSSSGSDSIFSRTVYVDGTSESAKITVRVRWKSHENIGVREITVVEYIYNWAGAILNPNANN